MNNELLNIIDQFDPDNIEKNKLISCYIRNTYLYRDHLKSKYIDLYGFEAFTSVPLKFLLRKTWEEEQREIRYLAIKSIQEFFKKYFLKHR